jgi:hypothetical protein
MFNIRYLCITTKVSLSLLNVKDKITTEQLIEMSKPTETINFDGMVYIEQNNANLDILDLLTRNMYNNLGSEFEAHSQITPKPEVGLTIPEIAELVHRQGEISLKTGDSVNQISKTLNDYFHYIDLLKRDMHFKMPPTEDVMQLQQLHRIISIMIQERFTTIEPNSPLALLLSNSRINNNFFSLDLDKKPFTIEIL